MKNMIDKSLNISVFFLYNLYILFRIEWINDHKQIYHNNYSATMLLFYSQFEYYFSYVSFSEPPMILHSLKGRQDTVWESASTNLNVISCTNRVLVSLMKMII